MHGIATLIHNNAAGPMPAGPFLIRAVRILERAGWEIEVVETRSGGDIPLLAAEAVRKDHDAVFVAGGDGTVGNVAARLAGSRTALGILPAGTANVLAQELGLRGLDWVHWYALEEAAHGLANGRIQEVDMGSCNGHDFLMWAGIGLDAEVIFSMEPRIRLDKALSFARYAGHTIKTSLEWEGLPLRITGANQTWEKRFMMAIISNIRSYAGGLIELTSDSKLDDGLLDFWLIESQGIQDALKLVVQVLRGDLKDAPGVVHFRASEALIEAEGELHMQIDGEPRKMDAPIRITVAERVLRVIVPEQAKTDLFSR